MQGPETAQTGYRYGGRVVHNARCGNMSIQVVDQGQTRSLHFGTRSRQSSMYLDLPNELVLAYTRAMMSVLLFVPTPRRVLLVGLGGGSFAKFFLHRFPACRVDVVERHAHVVKVAHGYFHLPQTDRLSIHVDDAMHYLARRPPAQRYDVIMLDAFTARGTPQDLLQRPFFDSCRAWLADHGALAANLWRGAKPSLRQTLKALRQSFSDAVLELPVRGRGNLAVFASPTPLDRQTLSALEPRAQHLQQHTGIELTTYLRQLRRGGGPLAWLLR